MLELSFTGLYQQLLLLTAIPDRKQLTEVTSFPLKLARQYYRIREFSPT